MKKTFTTGIIAGFLGGLFLMISTAAGTAAAISVITLDGKISISHKIEGSRSYPYPIVIKQE